MADSKNPEDVPSDGDVTPQEITLHDGDSVTLSVPTDGTTHVTVNMIPPTRSTGFFSSCLQGCGCLVLIIVILSAIGGLIR